MAEGGDKPAARKQAAAARARVYDPTGAAAQAACARLDSFLNARFGAARAAQVLAGYMAIGDELDPMAAMLAHPGPVCVPVVVAKGQALHFHRWTADTPMTQGSFGVAVPATPAPIVPDILIVPLLAFDAGGFRLGYGGGFYDRTLAALPGRLAIGFAHDAQQVDRVPRQPTDIGLDAIVTPTRVVVAGRA